VNLPSWQRPAWQNLAARRARGTLPHALLLCGADGLGKRAFAAAFAAALLCEAVAADGSACGTCRACRLVAAGTHPDRLAVGLEPRDDGNPRSEIVVEQIRRLGERLSLTAQFGGLQVALLDPADALNHAAANALLKTLEEPVAAAILVLVADQATRLPATIRSRCQRVEFRAPPPAEALAWLVTQGLTADRAAAALEASGGNPGLALRFARDGNLAVRSEVATDLRALLAGQGSAVELAYRWSKADADTRLWFAAALLAAEARARAAGGVGPLALTGRVELPKLSAGFDRINRAREHLRGPLRPELVVLDAIRDLATRGGSRD
jgi:DNA polymerase-3 subunit delta'